MKKILLAAALAIAGAGTAQAATISFTSNGSFSQLNNCSGCSITNNQNTLYMSGLNGSTMVANDITSPVTFQTNTSAANDVVLGSITWVNRASFFTDPAFNVGYSLSISFTAPNADLASELFTLNITQPTNPPGDNALFIGGSLAALGSSINLNGVTISDIHFREVGSGAFVGSNWSNPEGGTSQLQIVADFASPVPEPTTWAMMFIGFAGVAGLAYRRSRRRSDELLAST